MADVAVPAALLLAIVTLGRADGGIFVRRVLWLDEIHTAWIANRPRFPDVFSALQSGADFNPPLLFVGHWMLARFTGGASPIVLRVVAGLAMWAGLVIAYRILRRSFDPLPSLVGVAAIITDRLVLEHVFEARFYGPWLFLAALYVAALCRTIDTGGARRSQALAAGAAALLCLIHYFGIITLTLVTAGVGLTLLVRRQPVRPLVLPFLAGVAAVLLTLPMLRGQQAALSGPVWIPPACCAADLLNYVERFITAPPVAAALVIATAAWIFPPLRSRPMGDGGRPILDPGVAGLLALGLLPAALILIEIVGQPVLVWRYGLPAFLALAPIVAATCLRVRWFVQVACLAVLLVHGVLTARGQIYEARDLAGRRATETELARFAITQAREWHTVVLVPRRHVLYPLLEALPEDSSRLLALPILPADPVRRRWPLASDTGYMGSDVLMEQDVASVHRRVFGVPTLQPIDSGTTACFLLIEEQRDAPDFATRWLPHHQARRIRRRLFALEPRGDSGQARPCTPTPPSTPPP